MVELKARSFAKINLFLDVLAKRDDGYHEVDTLIQIIDLFDVLKFKEIEGNKIDFCSDSELIDPSDNTVIKAITLLKDKTGVNEGISVSLDKVIPIGSGLGGGSSNAACTLVILNKIWNLKLSYDELIFIGKEIGADVPCFISGSLSYATGRGDEIVPLINREIKHVLVVYPGIFISTRDAYSSLSNILTKRNEYHKIKGSYIQPGCRYENFKNIFEETIFLKFPELREIKRFLIAHGAYFGLMSGSGSSIYGLFDDEDNCVEVKEKIVNKFGCKTYLCKFMKFDQSKLTAVMLDF